VPVLAAESAAHWLQGEGRDRGRERGGRDKRWRVVIAGRRFFWFAVEIQEIHKGGDLPQNAPFYVLCSSFFGPSGYE